MKPRFRFAPSPNGLLHAGHIFSVEENFRQAREMNGEVLLRIEDIDQTRCRPHFEEAILERLKPFPFTGDIRRQSEHFAFYAEKIEGLNKLGLLYKDHTTRTGGVSESYALKLNMKAALAHINQELFWVEKGVKTIANPLIWGDVTLARKETPTSYHVSVVLDDALQNITHVVRGMDLYEQTSIHVLLQKLFNLPSPHYHHHALVNDQKGDKLSKSKP
jgi:glutamyl-Q tRNA(Asp) synthetase